MDRHSSYWVVKVLNTCLTLTEKKCNFVIYTITKGAAVLRRRYLLGGRRHFQASLRYLGCIHRRWMWMILTKVIALFTAEGSRLLQWGHTRHIVTCACFKYLTLRRSLVKEPTRTHLPAFYLKSHVTCTCNDITHDVTASISEVTSSSSKVTLNELTRIKHSAF